MIVGTHRLERAVELWAVPDPARSVGMSTPGLALTRRPSKN